MNSLLKRFNRGSENDHVLVLTLAEDKIRVRTVWESALFKRIRTTLFPYNVLLLELHEVREGTQRTAAVGYFVEEIWRMRLYCNEDDEICWEPSWQPPSEDNHLHSQKTLLNFPTNKWQFDQLFSRTIRDWHQNYNLWSIYIHDKQPVRLDYLDKISFRYVIGPSTEIHWTYNGKLEPWLYLIRDVVRALNATLESKSVRSRYDEGATISVGISDPLVNAVTNLHRRSYPVDFLYFGFAYGTNGSSKSFQAGNILVIFSPFDRIAWLLLAASSIATVLMFRFGGCTSPLLDTLACLVLQSRDRNKMVRRRFLAPLFLMLSLFSLFVTIIYCEFMESVLAVPALVPRIEDFKTLSERGYRPVVNMEAKIILHRSFRGLPYTDALADNLDLINFDAEIGKVFVKYLAGNDRRCYIFMKTNSRVSMNIWLEVAAFNAPAVTWSVGKEKIAFSPVYWSVFEPNAALMYHIFGILYSRGFIQKFAEYTDEKKWKFIEEVKSSEAGRRKVGRPSEQIKVEELMFTMGNPQMQAIFQGFAALNALGMLMLLVEVSLSVLHVEIRLS